MIELSKIKKITIKEGIVKKITNSSGVVLWSKPSTDTSSVTVDLNNQWVASTKKLDLYDVYMSNSNKGVANGYASMKIKFKGEPNFKIWINSYAESNYDYTIAFEMDVDYPTSNPSTGSIGIKLHTQGFQKDPTSIDNFKEVDYPNDGGEHFVVVTFRKDGSGVSNDDRGYVAIKLTPLSTSWVLSSTEFIKENDKYYQRINEVGTYEEGATDLTGNFKKGNELTPTYIQSSDAKDYMLVGSGMYYKKYAWVTPVDTAVNTGDYIQGDYIGEATPSMKVIYKDNTEKTFYNLTSIKPNTDANRKNSKNVEIYDSVTKIEDHTFSSCSELTSVTIGNGVSNIGIQAFSSCDSLSSVTIENSTLEIAYSTMAFYGISSTAKLYVPSNLLPYYKSDTSWTGDFKGGIYAIPKKETVVTYTDGSTKEFSINGEITSGSVENVSAATSVGIGNTVTSIGNNTFNRCYSLSGMSIPNSVTSIGDNAFYSCYALLPIIIPDSVKSIGSQAFSTCYKLSAITIPDSVTSIGSSAFSYCSSLASITIPDSVTNISSSLFNYCGNLSAVTIPNSVTSINDYAFGNCEKLPSIIIPSGVTSIGSQAFNKCANLAYAIIENSSEKLVYNTNAFSGISSAATLYVSDNLVSDYKADANWTGAFIGGIQPISSKLTIVTYNDGTVKRFNIDGKIKPNSIDNIGTATKIDIGNTVTGVDSYALQYSHSLTSVTIPNSVTSISDYAFRSCEKLPSIIIPPSVIGIYSAAFSYCQKLASVTIENSTSKLEYGLDTFYGISSTAKLYVPSNLLSDYQADTAWTGAFQGGIYAIGS